MLYHNGLFTPQLNTDESQTNEQNIFNDSSQGTATQISLTHAHTTDIVVSLTDTVSLSGHMSYLTVRTLQNGIFNISSTFFGPSGPL